MATGAGAEAYAGAAQEWKGKREIRTPKPTMRRAAIPDWASCEIEEARRSSKSQVSEPLAETSQIRPAKRMIEPKAR
jgi:hypothetical protein